MAGYNRIVIMGNLTRDPDYKQLSSGQAVCRLGLATNRQFKNKQSGSMVQEVCYIDIDVWGAQAESCRQYLQKGRSVLIEGRLKFDSWEDNGQTRSKHSVVADRVVFVGSNGGQSEDDTSREMNMQGAVRDQEPVPQLDKDILDQINMIKNKNAKKTTKKTDISAVPDVEFKDQPPFEDDLPF